MEDAAKPDEKKSEEPVEESKEEITEEPQPEIEPEVEESTEEEIKEEPVTEESQVEESEIEEQSEEPATEETGEKKEEPTEPKKVEEKKVVPKKKVDRGPDFKYIVRLSNTDVDGEKNVVYGLTSIKGIGLHMATLIADETGIDRYLKMGDLSDKQIEKLQEVIDNVTNNAPTWMLNRQKDYDTGEDLHLVGSDIDMKLRDEINILKKIRSYRGIRHERGLRVRGQRTRANNRKGLALGVSKKREVQP